MPAGDRPLHNNSKGVAHRPFRAFRPAAQFGHLAQGFGLSEKPLKVIETADTDFERLDPALKCFSALFLSRRLSW